MTDTDDEITRIGPGAYFNAAQERGRKVAQALAPERRGGMSVDTLGCMYAYALLVGVVPLSYGQDWSVAEWRRRAVNDFGNLASFSRW